MIFALCLLGCLALLLGHRTWIRRGLDHLQEAERLWMANHSTVRVWALLNRVPGTSRDLALRLGRMKALVHRAEGRDDLAWRALMQGYVSALPFRSRHLFRIFLNRLDGTPRELALRQGESLLPRLPHSGLLRHTLGFVYLEGTDEASQVRGWDLLADALPQVVEDVLLLENLMLRGLERLQSRRRQLLRLGKQDYEPELPFLFDEALYALIHRHGHWRLAWDRITPSRFLFEEGRFEDVFSVISTLPVNHRPPELWEVNTRTLREMGDLEGAWHAAVAALDRHPKDPRLWMERHQVALDRHMNPEALFALESARTCLSQGAFTGDFAWEWKVRRAEYAFWIEGQAREAWQLLSEVPEAHRGGQHPPLELELQVALGAYEEALHTVSDLPKERPEDLDLLLLQADCLAGMQAWDALQAHLDALPEGARARPDFWSLMGIVLFHQGQKVPSRECAERAAFMAQEDARLVMDAGHACMELGEGDRAAHHFRQVLRLNPSHEEALIQLSETRRLAHDLEGTKRYLRECLLHHPESRQAQEYLAELEAN